MLPRPAAAPAALLLIAECRLRLGEAQRAAELLPPAGEAWPRDDIGKSGDPAGANEP